MTEIKGKIYKLKNQIRTVMVLLHIIWTTKIKTMTRGNERRVSII